VSRPLVSVVVPTRDRPRLLARAIASVLGQSLGDLELIVVDDASRYDVAGQVGALGDARARVARAAGSGPAAARNAGMEHAHGEWVAFLDDDDLWAPGKLAEQLGALGSRGAWAYASAVLVTLTGDVLADLPADPGQGTVERLRNGCWLPAGASNVIARRELVARLGGFDETLEHFPDWDLWIRLAQTAPPAVAPARLVAYTEHPGNLTIRQAGRLEGDARRLAAKHRETGARVDVAGVPRFLAERAIRDGERRRAARTLLGGAWRHRRPRDGALALRTLLGSGSVIRAAVPEPASPVRDVAWIRQQIVRR
jgi:glycosyltransferase involved in cell wall biosynthesis